MCVHQKVGDEGFHGKLIMICRVLVQEGVHNAFVEKLQAAMESQLVLGDVFAEGVSQGPLINKSQYK